MIDVCIYMYIHTCTATPRKIEKYIPKTKEHFYIFGDYPVYIYIYLYTHTSVLNHNHSPYQRGWAFGLLPPGDVFKLIALLLTKIG